MLLFSLIVVGTGAFYSDMSTEYSINDSDNRSTYSQRTFITSFADDAEGEVKTDSGGLTQLTWSDLGVLVFTAPIKILSSFLDSINSLTGAFQSLVSDMGLPAWILPFIMAFISLIVVFAIINAVWKKEF